MWLFSFFEGPKIAGKISKEIGVDPRIFKTALTEAGVNFAFLKIEYRALVAAQLTEKEAIHELALAHIGSAYNGLKRLEVRFPDETSIKEAQSYMLEYAQEYSDKI